MADNENIRGHLSVGRNVTVGSRAIVRGDAQIDHNLKVKGWLEADNIKDNNKGVFGSPSALQAAYPSPLAGWYAGVYSTEGGAHIQMYRVVDGAWQDAGCEYKGTADYPKKADKVSGATEGNFAALNDDGNLLDSGMKPSDFALDGQVVKTVQQSLSDGQKAQARENIGAASESELETFMSDYRPIEIHGDVTNAADEEDLTSVNIGGSDVLRLKDKAYAPSVYSGMGRKILRKNVQTIGGVTANYLMQSDLVEANTVYVVRYDFSLGVPGTMTVKLSDEHTTSITTAEFKTLYGNHARTGGVNKEYADATTAYNTAADAYNDAVDAYNAAVDAWIADPTEENEEAMNAAENDMIVAEAEKDKTEKDKARKEEEYNTACADYEAIGELEYYLWDEITIEPYHALHLEGKVYLIDSPSATRVTATPNGLILSGSTEKTIYLASVKEVSGGTTIDTFSYRYDNCIVIPENSTLVFDGGSISNGVIWGDGTKIMAQREAIFTDIRIDGSWLVPNITTAWFSDATQNNRLRDVFALQNDSILNTLVVEQGNYTVSVEYNKGTALKCLSNLNLVINGNINLAANAFDSYNIVDCYDKHHISISGSGAIVGDKATHTGSTGEWGMGIEIYSSKFVTVKELKIKDCWGDCIYIGGTNTENIIVENCDIDNGRRQGISITNGENIIIRNCKIQNVSGTNPQAAIDIEPNSGKLASNIQIYNNYINNCTRGIIIYGRSSYTKTGILIENNYINCTWRAIAANGISTCITVKNNEMHSKYCLVDANTIDGSKDNVILFENNMMYQTDIAESPYNNKECAIYACKGDYMFKHNSIITAMPVFYFASGNKYVEDNDIVCPTLFYNHSVKDVRISGNRIVGNVTMPGTHCWFENNYVTGFFRSTVVSSDSSSRIIGNTITHPNDTVTRPVRYETDVDAWEDYLENGIMLDNDEKKLAISKYNCSNHAWEIFVNSSSPRIYNEPCVLKGSGLLIENNIFINVALEINEGKVSKNKFTYKSNFTITGQLLKLGATDFLFNNVTYKGTHEENENVYLVRARKYISNTFEVGNGSSVKYIMYPGGTDITISDNVVTLPEGYEINHIVSNVLANIKPIYNNKGETGNRPVFPVDERYYIGCQYFDTTLGKVIVWTGTNWVDASGSAVTHPLVYTLTNLTASNHVTPEAGETFETTLSVGEVEGYTLPTTITVEIGDTPLTSGTDYTYDSSTGEIEVLGIGGEGGVTGTLTINASAEQL